MTYEQAKQLKDAGFPHGICEWTDEHPNRTSNEFIPIPTLSELIEVTTKFPAQFSLYGRGNNRWEATLVGQVQPFGAPLSTSQTEYGSTPEEAVKNLWLALNKK